MANSRKKVVYAIAPDGTEFKRGLSTKGYTHAVLARYQGDSFFSDGWREVGIHTNEKLAQARKNQVSKYPNIAEVVIVRVIQ